MSWSEAGTVMLTTVLELVRLPARVAEAPAGDAVSVPRVVASALVGARPMSESHKEAGGGSGQPAIAAGRPAGCTV